MSEKKVKKVQPKKLRTYQRFINGVKVVVEAASLREANKEFNKLLTK
jgi:hypothetical protein